MEDLAELAATYAVALSKNHPFVDGNKRAAFLGLGLFLDLNGLQLTADDESATSAMYAVAASEMTMEALADWVRANSAPL